MRPSIECQAAQEIRDELDRAAQRYRGAEAQRVASVVHLAICATRYEEARAAGVYGALPINTDVKALVVDELVNEYGIERPKASKLFEVGLLASKCRKNGLLLGRVRSEENLFIIAAASKRSRWKGKLGDLLAAAEKLPWREFRKTVGAPTRNTKGKRLNKDQILSALPFTTNVEELREILEAINKRLEELRRLPAPNDSGTDDHRAA